MYEWVKMATFAAVLLEHDSLVEVDGTLNLTAEERRKRILGWQTEAGEQFYFELPRGIYLHDEDLVHIPDRDLVLRVAPRPEPVMTVRASSPLQLLRASYHLGNRHVPLQISETWLRFPPDPVIAEMLQEMGLTVEEEIVPFYPEVGAYHHHH
ncbi:MAG: urease accessory protein UreE [Pseudanabaenaceae cyanobacterium SKYGB_i_bin29]|nr:urease accessory protein UreE [Pseudanabaenaceae cyanobacterium SKYG29]MDW8421819.1 urease accessory protein UreE [Pseudanabaenaceae cyanobacterium SKYGB_i_bin29]